MFHHQLEERRRSDYFQAQQIAVSINNPKEGVSLTADDILLQRYPKRKDSGVIITPHDPDMGALGGSQLRVGLKARTKAFEDQRKRNRRYKK